MTSPSVHVTEEAVQSGGPQVSAARSTLVAVDSVSAETRWGEYLMYLSMALLLLSTIQETGLIGDAVKVTWLVSVALLTVLNAGAAFGVYVAAVALFGVLSFDGWASVVERPDNYAFPLVAGGLALRVLARRSVRPWDQCILIIGCLLAYALVQTAWMGLLTRLTFVAYMRMLGFPLLMFLLLRQYGFSLRELRALVNSLLILGAYMAVVSIAEGVGWYGGIMPAWIANPFMSFIDPWLTEYFRSGRSGGLLMQPEYNGLALSLIYCIAILSARVLTPRTRWVLGVVGLLCLVGIIFTFTRAAWLACAPASFILLWRRSATRSQTHLKRFALGSVAAAFVLPLVLLPDSFARQRIGEPLAVYARVNLWKAGLRMAAERPLLGSGFESFAVNLQDYEQEMTVGPGAKVRNITAHNTVLSVFTELGTIGFVLYAAAMVAIFRRTKAAAIQRWGREGALWVAVFAGVYFLEVQFVVAQDLTTNLLFFGMMGAIAGLVLHAPAGQDPPVPVRS